MVKSVGGESVVIQELKLARGIHESLISTGSGIHGVFGEGYASASTPLLTIEDMLNPSSPIEPRGRSPGLVKHVTGLNALFDDQMISLINKLVDNRVEANLRALGLDASVLNAAGENVRASNHTTLGMMSCNDFASKLGVVEETVRLRERNGELYSILPPGKKKGRQYPAFLLVKEVREAVGPIIETLHGFGNSSVHAFLTSRNDLLCGLTPVDVLRGVSLAPLISAEAIELLNQPQSVRRTAVNAASAAFAADLT